MIEEVKKLKGLAASVQNLADTMESLIDSQITAIKRYQELEDEFKTLQNDNIYLCNRLNEVELSLDSFKKPKKNTREPLVMPVIDRRRTNMLIKTPYPKPNSRIRKVVSYMRRLVNAST